MRINNSYASLPTQMANVYNYSHSLNPRVNKPQLKSYINYLRDFKALGDMTRLNLWSEKINNLN